MESFDTDMLISIYETTCDVILGYANEKKLSDKLLDFNEHQRETLVHCLISCLKKGMSLSLEIDAFNTLILLCRCSI